MAVKASSVPALVTHDSSVATAEAIHAAATAAAKDEVWMPGTRLIAICSTTAWPTTARASTATHPIREATRTMTGRTIAPTIPATRAAAA